MILFNIVLALVLVIVLIVVHYFTGKLETKIQESKTAGKKSMWWGVLLACYAAAFFVTLLIAEWAYKK